MSLVVGRSLECTDLGVIVVSSSGVSQRLLLMVSKRRREQAAALEYERIFQRFQEALEPRGSIQSTDREFKDFMRHATFRLLDAKLPPEWESFADRVGKLARASFDAEERLPPRTRFRGDVYSTEENRVVQTDRLIALGEEIGELGGGWLMVLIAHRARYGYGADLRHIEWRWHGICGWMR